MCRSPGRCTATPCRAAARAAARHGVPYTHSSVSTATIEEVASVGGQRWFQLYVWQDRKVVADLVARAKGSGYDALCLTVEVPVAGRRLRDVRTGLAIPRVSGRGRFSTSPYIPTGGLACFPAARYALPTCQMGRGRSGPRWLLPIP